MNSIEDNYGILFLSRIEQNYDNETILSMLKSDKLPFEYIIRAFVKVCKSNDIKYANLIMKMFPNNFLFQVNDRKCITRFHIIDEV